MNAPKVKEVWLISARYNVTKDIAKGAAHQEGIFYEGLQLMQKNYEVHRDIERLYLKRPVKI